MSSVLLDFDVAYAWLCNQRKDAGPNHARFMDDFLFLAPGQRTLRKAINIVYRVLRELKLTLHPDKRFIGRVTRGFDFFRLRVSLW